MSKEVGRPTLLTNEIKEKAWEYIDWFMSDEAQDMENNLEVIPSMAGLAIFLGVSRRALYLWRDKDDEFMHTLEALQNAQESILINNGLKGKFNPTISKLALANHGYSDKQEVAMTVNPLDEILDEIEYDARTTSEESEE